MALCLSAETFVFGRKKPIGRSEINFVFDQKILASSQMRTNLLLRARAEI